MASRWTLIKPDETAGELHDRLAGIGVDAVQAALDMYAGASDPQGTPQDDAESTTAPKLKKTDGLVRFDQDVRSVVNHIRGMTPWPGARVRFESRDGRWENVHLVRARPAEDPSSPMIAAGAIDARCHVAAGDGFVEILEIKPSSGRVMPWRGNDSTSPPAVKPEAGVFVELRHSPQRREQTSDGDS